MKLKRKSKLPDFSKMAYEEEANFWDTHSFTDFEDELEDVNIIFDLHKSKPETLVLRLQDSLKKGLEKVAKTRGLNVSALARMWLSEKLQSAQR